jgi:hypothetical protein
MKVDLGLGIESAHGKPNKRSKMVMRQKEFRAPSGKVMFKGKQEAFEREPRDFDKTPPQGAELANMRSFGDVSLASSAIIRAGKMNEEELAALPEEERTRTMELREMLSEFHQRFYAQLKTADPEAPFEKKLRPGASKLRRRQYMKIDTFIQAILRERARLAQN